MLQIRDNDVIKLIERASYHYHFNIANRVLRPAILQLYLDERTWSFIETFTEKLEVYRSNGYKLDDLYRQIAACARFVATVRNGIHAIKTKVRSDIKAPDRTYREMTVNNLPNNLKVFADILNILYTLLVDFDKKNSGNNNPVFTQIPELESVSRILNSAN
ncbi:MAG: hypothetical protein FWC22_00820 [Treponema sp.]|nr:hypothetical protein [Treponema sp.]